MRVVARPGAIEALREHGAVYVWPRGFRCCAGRMYVLDASFDRPDREVVLVHCSDSFQVHATPGLVEPDELHFELDRKGRVHAYWNNQAWIG